jgi:predicted acyl esterase
MAHEFEVIEHIWIPMPDGIRLSLRLWLPARTEEQG